MSDYENTCEKCGLPTEYNEYENIRLKDSPLYDLTGGDELILCEKCGENLSKTIKKWLEGKNNK